MPDTKGINLVLGIILYMQLYKWSLILGTSFPIANPIQNIVLHLPCGLECPLPTATCHQGYISIQFEK